MCHLGNNLLPVQLDIRTFLERKLLRLVQPFPRSCMDKQNRMHTKMHTKYERRSASLANAGFAKIVPRVRIPLPPPHHYSTQFQIIPYSYHNHCNSKVYRGLIVLTRSIQSFHFLRYLLVFIFLFSISKSLAYINYPYPVRNSKD